MSDKLFFTILGIIVALGMASMVLLYAHTVNLQKQVSIISIVSQEDWR